MANVVTLVDRQGEPHGSADKLAAHEGAGQLHRALTCILFDTSGRIVFARRAAGKLTWPGYWDATVATHHLPDETDESATRRRAGEELNTDITDCTCPTNIVYRARYSTTLIELEHCAVLTARVTEAPRPDPAEVDALAFVERERIRAFVATHPVSPWFLEAWQALATLPPTAGEPWPSVLVHSRE